MADQSEVEAALVEIVSSALYPQGTNAGSAVGSVCRVYRGWPGAAGLDTDLAGGRVNVTVYALDEVGRTTTRWADEWIAQPVTPTLTASLSGDGMSVTFGGSADPGQLAGLLVDRRAYVYRTATGDTPETVAGALAALVMVNQQTVLSAATLTLPEASQLVARVAADVPSFREIRRQRQTFTVAIWCPTPLMRDSVASRLDLVLANLTFMALPDGSVARLRYVGTKSQDQGQNAALYRRDLLYSAEYATTVTALQPAMLFGIQSVNETQGLT